LSLRSKVLVGVAAANLAVFGVLTVFVARATAGDAQRQEEYAASVEGTLRRLFARISFRARSPDRLLREILRWPGWWAVRDAVLFDDEYVRLGDDRGDVIPTGLFLNPLGAKGRAPDFDLERAKRLVGQAIEGGRAVTERDAIALPIHLEEDPEPRVWGGGYFLLHPLGPPAMGLSLQGLAIGFVVSTVLLTAVTFLGLSRFVLRPVEGLAKASRRIARGEDVVVAVPSRREDEIVALVDAFAAMLATIRAHRAELEREVAEASRRAAQAERDLMLAQRLAAMGTLAAGIAHEINNPLGGMINAARAVAAGAPPDRRAEYLDLLLEGLDRVRAIVGRLLAFTPAEGSPVPLPLSGPVEAAAAFVAHRAEREGVALRVEVSSDAWVRGDARELGQAFLNLLLNALDALGPERGGTIAVEASREGREVVARVRDDGPGMEPRVLERAFDLFFTTKATGSGLGLPLVHRIVEDHGGRVDLRNRPEGGFEVEVRFPAAEAEGGRSAEGGLPETARAAKLGRPSSASSGGGGESEP